MDEPTVGLDPISRRDLWQYLRRVREASDTTIFLTTHYLQEAEEADMICMLNKGRIVSYGTPLQVKADLVEDYLLIDAADRDALRAELLRQALPFTEMPLFKISLSERTAYQIIKAIETPLTLIQTHTPTLEEAYFAIVGNA